MIDPRGESANVQWSQDTNTLRLSCGGAFAYKITFE